MNSKVLLGLNAVMVLMYAGLGSYMILFSKTITSFSPETNQMLGCFLIIYGLFRAYRAYKSYQNQNNA
jgi:hypothetical protein